MTSSSRPLHQTWKLQKASTRHRIVDRDVADAVPGDAPAARPSATATAVSRARAVGAYTMRAITPSGHALGEVLALAVGLPAPERREGAVGDVALRLAVTDEAHVRTGRDAPRAAPRATGAREAPPSRERRPRCGRAARRRGRARRGPAAVARWRAAGDEARLAVESPARRPARTAGPRSGAR